MTTTKTYPRAKVSRHATLNGWVIDLLLRAGAKPIKVNATYATIEFAHKAALSKLGVKADQAPVKAASPLQQEWKQGPERTPTPAKVAAPKPGRAPMKDYGTCGTCKRPMRPAGTKSSDHPGTTLRQREGLCQSCNNKAKS